MTGKYVIAEINPKHGKHNFYHDEMRGSIATIVSAEVGDGAVIRYIPEYDGLPHYVTTSTVSSIEEKDGTVSIETNNTSYIFQAVTEARFASVWDGGLTVTTDCKVNLVTNEVFYEEARSLLKAMPILWWRSKIIHRFWNTGRMHKVWRKSI